jgi:AraC-like DNA-binding protein
VHDGGVARWSRQDLDEFSALRRFRAAVTCSGMRVVDIAPSPALSTLVRAFTVVEATEETTRVLLPDTGIILGLRYGGRATQLENGTEHLLPDAALTGIRQTVRRIRTSAGGGILLATLREGAGASVLDVPLDELSGSTVPLEDVLPRAEVVRVADQLAGSGGDAERVAVFERFLLARSRDRASDPLVAAAVRALRSAEETARIGDLAATLRLSQDRLEKRFRRSVGTTPRQLATLLRLRRALASHRAGNSLSQASIESGYFDQSHFIRDFRAVTGESPRRFFEATPYC